MRYICINSTLFLLAQYKEVMSKRHLDIELFDLHWICSILRRLSTFINPNSLDNKGSCRIFIVQ